MVHRRRRRGFWSFASCLALLELLKALGFSAVSYTHLDVYKRQPIEELIARAHRVGITNIAVTEHYPLTPQVDPRDFVSMHADRLPEYFERILAQRAKYPDMEVLVGCELDWLGQGEDRAFAPDRCV